MVGEFEFSWCSFAFSFVELEFARDEGVHGRKGKTFRNKIDNEDDGERGWRNKIVWVTRIPKEVKKEN